MKNEEAGGMNEDPKMQISLPKRGAIEWNLNTILQLVTLFSILVGGVSVWVNTSRDILEINQWKKAHDELHRERSAEARALEARFDERLKGNESEIGRIKSDLGTIVYRVSTNESATNSVIKTMSDVQAAQAQQAGDLRLIREILQRLERSMGAGQ